MMRKKKKEKIRKMLRDLNIQWLDGANFVSNINLMMFIIVQGAKHAYINWIIIVHGQEGV